MIIRTEVEFLYSGLEGTWEEYKQLYHPIEIPRCRVFEDRESSTKEEYYRVYRQNLRAEKLGLEHTLTLSEWLDILNTYNRKCAYCNKPFTDLDHFIPISKGGGTTKENSIPACGHCNNQKSNKLQYCKRQFL
jgi:5-methylcytosine-specific restriction endonuclease McrA